MTTPRHPAGRPEGGQYRAPAGDAAAVTAAAEQAAHARMSHYEANTHGQGSACGDPAPAESTLQPPPQPPLLGDRDGASPQ